MATLQTLPDVTTVLPSGSAGASAFAARAFLYAIFKHRRLVIGVWLLVFVASAISAWIRPSTWRATSKVMVKLGETVQLAPAEAPSKSYALPLSPQVVNTEAEIVKSREVLDEAVRRLGIVPEGDTSPEEMLAGMSLALSVQPTPSSNVLQISYVGRDPKRASRMVNAITDVYLDHHNRVYSNAGVHSFYTEQLGILKEQMKESQRRLRGYLRKGKVVDADQEIHLLNQDVIEQDKGLQAHRLKIKGVDRKLVEVHAQLERTPSQVPYSEEFLSNPTIQTYKDRMAQLEIEHGQLLQRYVPNDRFVQDKEAEIANVRRRITEEKERVLSKQTIQQNEVFRQLQGNDLTFQTMLADLHAREPGLVGRLQKTRDRLHSLRDMRFKIENMKQDADQKEYAFDLYWRKQEEARTTEAMKNQSMVAVSIVEHAIPPLDPVNGPLLPLLLGLIGGIGLATAMAVAVEYLNRRLRFEEEVERYLELPVLAVIPDLETQPSIAQI